MQQHEHVCPSGALKPSRQHMSVYYYRTMRRFLALAFLELIHTSSQLDVVTTARHEPHVYSSGLRSSQTERKSKETTEQGAKSGREEKQMNKRES
ncbi:hypothetical protein ZHAS_00015723 [Anopheles sinensis]|uniref:Uncharacterized protein n=1 Tax=Anopheles sinensis TaxID=74873 RepID=A0A084WBT4_ANOSI|nr:hypothetical protein ZHAS_00015723 [Anopheles sinensis]